MLTATVIGSPPRVRGIDTGGTGGYLNSGITPACAGNSNPRSESREYLRDHPRVCGE